MRGVTFHNLHYGIHLIAAFSEEDSIAYCQFNDCVTGIYNLNCNHIGTITNCSFAQQATENQMVGIYMMNTAPRVISCGFNNCQGGGIKTEMSTYYDLNGIYDCTFNNCSKGIESRNSSVRIWGCTFYSMQGLVCHTDSNLRLCPDAFNVLNNRNTNITFTDTQYYQTGIQLDYGHNDFYHYHDPSTDRISKDFSFSFDQYMGWDQHVVSATDNWFADNEVLVNPDEYAQYVEVHDFDPQPHTQITSLDDNRYIIALQLEYNQQFSEACDMYKSILNDPLPEEKQFLGACADGIYRISLNENYPVTACINYYDAKVLQYAVSDPYLSKLLQAYLMKEYIVGNEFQEAIDILQLRIDNPVSEIDSLQAVLDIEIILQIAALEAPKRPLAISCPQYRYPDVQTFTKKHNEHWEMMLALLNEKTPEEYPIPVIATLYQNFPNPFNPSTTISFAIPRETNVKICLYNIKGQLVKHLCSDNMKRGYHKLTWNGKDEQGKSAGSGLYFIRMESDNKVLVKKAMLLK